MNYYISIWRKEDKEELVKEMRETLIKLDKKPPRYEEEKILREFQSFMNEYEYSYGKKTRIHIGKSSHGWKFLFDSQRDIYNEVEHLIKNEKKRTLKEPIKNDYYTLSREGLDSFLREQELDGNPIVNEDGDIISVDEFWDMVESKKNGHDSVTYDKAHPEEKSSYIIKGYHDVYYDDLRISTFTNFS